MVISGKDINMGESRQIIYNFVLDQIKHKLIKKTSDEKALSEIGNQLAREWHSIATELGLPYHSIQNYEDDFRGKSRQRNLHMLMDWWRSAVGSRVDKIQVLKKALSSVKRNDIAGQVDDLFSAVSETSAKDMKALEKISEKIGTEYHTLGIELGVEHSRIDQIDRDNPGNTKHRNLCILREWWNTTSRVEPREKKLKLLQEAFKQSHRRDLAEQVDKLFES